MTPDGTTSIACGARARARIYPHERDREGDACSNMRVCVVPRDGGRVRVSFEHHAVAVVGRHFATCVFNTRGPFCTCAGRFELEIL